MNHDVEMQFPPLNLSINYFLFISSAETTNLPYPVLYQNMKGLKLSKLLEVCLRLKKIKLTSINISPKTDGKWKALQCL